MKHFLLFSALVVLSSAALTPKQQLCNKVMKFGITSKVSSNTTIANILTCFEPSILARKPAANLTSDLANCVLSKSSNYYLTVMSIYNTMNNCIGRDTVDMLNQWGAAVGPVLLPLYDTMMSKLKYWIVDLKLTNAQTLNKWYTWIVKQGTFTLIDTCCKKVVNKAGLSQKDWTCTKDPTKGGQAVNIGKYACATMMPPVTGK